MSYSRKKERYKNERYTCIPKKPIKAYLEPKEIAILEQAASNLRDKILIHLLFRLGCRISEALSIKVDDIDFNQGTVMIIHLKRRLKLSCPNCRARLGAAHVFCPHCGGKIEKPKLKSSNTAASGCCPLIVIP